MTTVKSFFLTLALTFFGVAAQAASMPIFSESDGSGDLIIGAGDAEGTFFDNGLDDIDISAFGTADITGLPTLSSLTGELAVSDFNAPDFLLFSDTILSSDLTLDIANGTGTLELIYGDLTGTQAADFNGAARALFSFTATDTTFTTFDVSAQIFATPIPLPASSLMLLAGLGGFAAMRRRRS